MKSVIDTKNARQHNCVDVQVVVAHIQRIRDIIKKSILILSYFRLLLFYLISEFFLLQEELISYNCIHPQEYDSL